MKNCEDAHSAKKPPIIQYFATFAGTLHMVCSGMHYGWSSVSLPQLLPSDSHISMTDDDGSWIAVMLLMGAVCGSVLAGILLDKFGRKQIILFASAPFFTSWIMVAFAQSVKLLFVARFLAGISDGLIFCTVPIYLGEISDPRIRGFTGCIISVSLIFGMFLISVIGTYLSITTTALVSSVLPIMVLVTFPWMPESPYYLIMKHDHKQAKKSLKIFKGIDDVDQELHRLVRAVEEQKSNGEKYLDLFTVASNRKALFIVLAVRGTHQFTGVTAITFYIETIFSEAGDSISPSISAMLYFGMQVIISGFGSVIVDKIGRKPLMVISTIGVATALLTEGCYFTIKNTTDIDTSSFAFVSMVGFILYVVVYNIGIMTIPVLLVGEVFPTNVKSFAVCLSDIYECLIAVILSKFLQFTKDEFGLHVPLFGFAVLSILGVIFIIFYVPETKGKTLEEIQDQLKGKKDACEKNFHELTQLKQ